MPELRIRPALEAVAELFPSWGERPTLSTLEELRAVMCWPRDEQARMTFHRLLHLQLRSDWEQAPHLADDPLFIKLFARDWQAFGGAEAFLETPPYQTVMDEAERRSTRGEWAGATLCLAHLLHTRYADRLEGPISLRKVRALLARQGSPFFQELPGPRALNDAWEEFQPVAHLWAGSFFVGQWLGATLREAVAADMVARSHLPPPTWQPSDLFLSHLGWAILSLATTFQEFGLAYLPKHARKPLLDPEQLWRLVDVPVWPVAIPAVDLPAELLERFDDYGN